MNDLNYALYSDEHLLSEFLSGDINCFGAIYDRYYLKVFSKCFSFSKNRDDAFDMTQEILLKAAGNAASFEGKSKFSTWLYSISHNYCISHSCKINRNYHVDLISAQYIIEERMDDEALMERLNWEVLEAELDECLYMLPDDERKLLVLKYRENYSVKDLQNEFNLSASAIKMRLLRARLKLSQIMSLEVAA